MYQLEISLDIFFLNIMFTSFFSKNHIEKLD